MTLAENELSEIRSASGIILYAKHKVVSNSQRLLEIILRSGGFNTRDKEN
jgi:hypothetical protein